MKMEDMRTGAKKLVIIKYLKFSLIICSLLVVIMTSSCESPHKKESDDTQTPVSIIDTSQNSSDNTFEPDPEPTPSNPSNKNTPTTSTKQNLMDGIIRLDQSAQEVEYHRYQYEPDWSIPNENCTIRSKILEKSSLVSVQKNNNCTVIYGKWKDPYTGKILEGNPYLGDGKQNDLDIDHIIPLHYVNNHGGYSWDESKKHLYGASVQSMNDDIYLAVSASANREKGDKGPSEWMPSNQDYVCSYIISWTKIAKMWNISLDPKDYDFISDRITNCQ